MTEEKFWKKFENSEVCISFKKEEEFDSFKQMCKKRGMIFGFEKDGCSYEINYQRYLKGDNVLHFLNFKPSTACPVDELLHLISSIGIAMGMPEKFITCEDVKMVGQIAEVVKYEDVFNCDSNDKNMHELTEYIRNVQEHLETSDDVECFQFTVKFKNNNRAISCLNGSKLDAFNMLMNTTESLLEEDDKSSIYIDACIEALQEMKKELKKNIE